MTDDHVRDPGGVAPGRTSLVDDAERSVREWLEPARFRAGDRLPTEERLAAMLGVSRGTLRSALRRLEAGGEIVRRQGSGTFVGRLPPPPRSAVLPLRVNSYTARARSGRVVLRSLNIERVPAEDHVAAALEVPPGSPVTRIDRVLVTEAGGPIAVASDTPHPEVQLPDAAALSAALQARTFHDVLTNDVGIPFSLSRTRIDARLVGPTDSVGRLLELSDPTACLMLEEQGYAAGQPMLYSFDLIVPGQIDLGFVQSAGESEPGPIG